MTGAAIGEAGTGESYAQWVRRIVSHVRGRPDLVSFFDSSVPEPTALLRETILGAFSPAISSRYTSAFGGGNPYVLDLLAARYAVPREHLFCTTGATGALSLLYRALLGPGDHVLVETPGFDLFADLAGARGAAVGTFRRRADDGYALDTGRIERAMRPDTRLVVLSDLHNPSGTALAPADLEALACLADRRGIYVIVDEVYADYADAGARPLSAAAYSPHLIGINSLTKIFGLATLRCGWIVAAPAVMRAVREIGEREEFGVSNLSHAVAALVMADAARYRAAGDAVLGAARGPLAERVAVWRAEGLVEVALPRFGCICFPRLVGIDDTARFSEWLAGTHGVIVAPGEFFGAPGHVRIGFAQPLGKLARGLDALEAGMRLFRAEAALVCS